MAHPFLILAKSRRGAGVRFGDIAGQDWPRGLKQPPQSPAHALGVFGHAMSLQNGDPWEITATTEHPSPFCLPTPHHGSAPIAGRVPLAVPVPLSQCQRRSPSASAALPVPAMRGAGSVLEQELWARGNAQRAERGGRRGVHEARAPPTLLPIPHLATGAASHRGCATGAGGGGTLVPTRLRGDEGGCSGTRQLGRQGKDPGAHPAMRR